MIRLAVVAAAGAEAEQVDQGGDGQDAAAAAECAERQADDGSGDQGEYQCGHATVPLLAACVDDREPGGGPVAACRP